MSLKLRKATERGNKLATVGTVAEFAGKGGDYKIASHKNFKGVKNENGVLVQKKVSILITDKDGNFEYVNCSKDVSAYLRESESASQLEDRMEELGSLPILELPQTETDKSKPTFGEPIMVENEEGEEVQLVLYSISFDGAPDTSATSKKVTDAMLKKETAKRAINFEDLIAM